MRIMQLCRFNTDTKVPFQELPGIVHQFLDGQGLKYGSFMYNFSELYIGSSFRPYESVEDQMALGKCARAVKDCPALGPVKRWRRQRNDSDYIWIGNTDGSRGATEADILSLMPKICKRYGFKDAMLYYMDIDFFGDAIPSEDAALDEIPGKYRQGSWIRLYRNAVFRCAVLLMSIDLLHHGEVMDATPYIDAMKALLPGVRMTTWQEILLTGEEKAAVEVRNERASGEIEKCRRYFMERIEDKDGHNFESPHFAPAKKLKELGKMYGYGSYTYDPIGVYQMDKRAAGGHVLRFEVAVPPSRYRMEMDLTMYGLGFQHNLFHVQALPGDQKEMEAALEQAFSAMAEFERTEYPALSACFPDTPEWFAPILF